MEMNIVSLIKGLTGNKARRMRSLLNNKDIVNAILTDFEATGIIYNYLGYTDNGNIKKAASVVNGIIGEEVLKLQTPGTPVTEEAVRFILAGKLLGFYTEPKKVASCQEVFNILTSILDKDMGVAIPDSIKTLVTDSLTINFNAKMGNQNSSEEAKERKAKEAKARKEAQEKARKAKEAQEKEKERKEEEARKAKEQATKDAEAKARAERAQAEAKAKETKVIKFEHMEGEFFQKEDGSIVNAEGNLVADDMEEAIETDYNLGVLSNSFFFGKRKNA